MMGEPCPWILDVTLENFDKEVVERSREVPVIVDFWAEWCQPCRQLAPTLEKIVRAAKGQLVLAKVNVDQCGEIAGWFGVQQIPAVFLLKDGQPVDQFMGPMPEAQIQNWLSRYLPSPTELLLKEAAELESTNAAEAEEKYNAALQADPELAIARIGLARIAVAQHRDQDAREMIQQLEARGYLEPEAQNLKAELDLRAAALETGGVAEAKAAAQADPDNPDLQLHLAEALAGAHQYPEALEICLNVIRNHKATHGEGAKTTMVQMFQVLGNGSELTQQYRRKLATALY